MEKVTLSNFSSLTYEEKFESIKNELKGKVHLYKVMAHSLAEGGMYYAQRTHYENNEWHWWFVTDNGVECVAKYVSPHRSRKMVRWITEGRKRYTDSGIVYDSKITLADLPIIIKYLRSRSYTSRDVVKDMGWYQPKVSREVHSHDILWSYLKNAQMWSDAAKGDGDKWDYCQKEAYKTCPYAFTRTWTDALNDAKDHCYRLKQQYIDKAVKRARQINLQVVYDTTEECIYFETEQGQCSFHDFRSISHFESLGALINEHYQWSGLRNTRDIIYKAVGKTA